MEKTKEKAGSSAAKAPKVSRRWRSLFAKIPNYDPIRTAAAGDYFDVQAAELAVSFFEECLTHTKGELAGQPFKLEAWEVAIVGAIWGWKRRDGTRRYRECLVYIPRKNGKSALAAGLALLGLFVDDEPGAEIYSAAAEREQAALVFDVAARMVQHEPELLGRCSIYRRAIVRERLGSSYKPISADARSKHGFNSHLVVVDELHAHRDRELLDALTTSTGARRQPLVIMLTTADHDRPSICNERYDYAKKVCKRVVEDPAFLPVIFEASSRDRDSFQDPKVWEKANPNIDVSISRDYLAREAEKAANDPLYLPTFLRLHLNIRVGAGDPFINLADWDRGADPIPTELLQNVEAYAGLDLSATNDLTALVLAFPSDGCLDVIPHFWIPEEDAERRSKRDRVPYLQWAEEGYLTMTPGRSVDHQRVEEDIVDIFERYQIRAVAMDSWNSLRTQRALDELGFQVVEVRQGFRTMNAPTKELSRLVRSGLIRHGAHPVLRWCASNCAVDRDAADNVKPSKRKSSERIDGIVALINALYLSLLELDWDELDAYKDHGVRYI